VRRRAEVEWLAGLRRGGAEGWRCPAEVLAADATCEGRRVGVERVTRVQGPAGGGGVERGQRSSWPAAGRLRAEDVWRRPPGGAGEEGGPEAQGPDLALLGPI
jgi:hypothetical protein